MESRLADDLDHLEAPLRVRLDQRGFEPKRLQALADGLASGEAPEARRDARNRVRGAVHGPTDVELLQVPEAGSPEAARLAEVGRAAMARGELAFCVMAGGMATRMGGVVKALVPAFDDLTFLDVRLRENAKATAKAGKPVPLWLMTSEATEGPIREALAARHAPPHVATFEQDLSLRLTPEGRLFRADDGHPSAHATGHGDLPDALRRSGLLASFRAGGGKYVWITNVDNLGATVDETILGLFVSGASDAMVEVCDKQAGDRGGIPVHAEGRLQVLEEFRLPKDFDATTVRVFNTNTFLLRAAALDEARFPWTFFEVEKKVDGRPAIQLERLLQELTAHLPSTYLRVSRHGTDSRFEPIKDNDELARRRDAIRAIAASRGIV